MEFFFFLQIFSEKFVCGLPKFYQFKQTVTRKLVFQSCCHSLMLLSSSRHSLVGTSGLFGNMRACQTGCQATQAFVDNVEVWSSVPNLN